MIKEQIVIDLPPPWSQGQFETEMVGPINYLVGPNGSGKTRFATELLIQLRQRSARTRLLGTDRLTEMAKPGNTYWRDNLESGYAKNKFQQYREAGEEGSGIDTILLLEERMDLRIRIEATLSHLFGRDVTLEWDSGNLVPRAVRREGGESYRLDREECHGIKELFVLLTHLYDNQHDYLIIDEPELNLHPQYQAFFMQEVRKVAGKPGDLPHKKIVFLITHSPFMLDLRSEEDIRSIISFDLEYSVPRQIAGADTNISSTVNAAGRINAHHKQLFFSDNPVFVEGSHDALIVEALMEARGLSMAAAGSCIINCGGVEEVNHYLNLCHYLGKRAHFIYDLDSLFKGQLRSCISANGSVQNFLASTGVGPDFARYIGELDRLLTKVIDILRKERLSGKLETLGDFFCNLGKDRNDWKKPALPSARVATMTEISRYREEIVSIVPQKTIEDIEGRWRNILSILEKKNIHVLPGGKIERYLRSFSGDLLRSTPASKQNAILEELKQLQSIRETDERNREKVIADRYGDLYQVVKKLPSKSQVDFDRALRQHLSDYIHELQKVVEGNPDWEREQIEGHMNKQPLHKNGVVSLQSFHRVENGRFEATIGISEMFSEGERIVEVSSETTIANMTLRKTEPSA